MSDIKLPKGILKSDLKRPSWKSKVKMAVDTARGYGSLSFDLWYTERFGWCIPTLAINNSRRHGTYRTYATSVDGQGVRIGNGPHVKATHTVYVKASRKKVLQKFIDLQHTGEIKANETRDRISTRRMGRYW